MFILLVIQRQSEENSVLDLIKRRLSHFGFVIIQQCHIKYQFVTQQRVFTDLKELPVILLRMKFHRTSPIPASRFPLPASHFTLATSRVTSLCSTGSHHAHNRLHLCNIFLITIHPSQFTYRQKVNKHTFPIHSSSRIRRELVWDIIIRTKYLLPFFSSRGKREG